MRIKFPLLFMFLVATILQPVFGQDNKTVTLAVSGQGKTQDEAKQAALRNAIEQAFGTFISSNTKILNDELIKDEIVSVANGNIQKFDIISEVKMPDGDYATTLKATVSVTKLTSFVESKGINIEFKGSLFAFNVNQQILNEKNELKAIEDLCSVVTSMADYSFNYSLTVSEPISVDASNEKWRIPIFISITANSNLLNIAQYLYSTLKGLSLSTEDANNYIKLGKIVYPISFAATDTEYCYVLLRNKESIPSLIKQLYYFNHSLLNFKISNGLATWQIADNRTKNDRMIGISNSNLKYIYDYGFRIFMRMNYKGSVFYTSSEGCPWGKDKEITERVLEDENYSSCRILIGDNPKLDYRNWYNEIKEKIFTKSDPNTPYYLSEYSITSPTSNKHPYGDYYFIDQFTFVNNLKELFISNNESGRYEKRVSGLVISFIGINTQKEIVRIYVDDILSLEEINKIAEYKIIPNGNSNE
ncbi:MAG: LPP20 family lipoprotein [Bacteroidetes bacterium]|nr:LPP20 family lipoprotein [Bacteroidota bacterium]